MIVSSITYMLFFSPGNVLATMLGASAGGIQLGITLCGIYMVWCGIVQIAVDSGLIAKLARLLSPIIRFLFGKQSPEVNSHIATNISANMIGAGAAATPAAISAIEAMDKERDLGDCADRTSNMSVAQSSKSKPSTPMVMLFILSATSLQIIPTTVIGILQQHGATNPGSIILPTLLVSTLTTIIGIIGVKVLGGFRGGRK